MSTFGGGVLPLSSTKYGVFRKEDRQRLFLTLEVVSAFDFKDSKFS